MTHRTPLKYKESHVSDKIAPDNQLDFELSVSNPGNPINTKQEETITTVQCFQN